MAVVFMEGFDHLTAAQHTIKGWAGAGGSGVTTGRLGGQAMHFGGTGLGTVGVRGLPALYSEAICGFAFKTSSITTDTDFFAFRNGSTNVIRLGVTTSLGSQVLRVRNSGGTLLGSVGTTPILLDTWYYVEVRCVVNASTGEAQVRLNGLGTNEINATSANTGSSNIDTIVFGGLTTNNTYYDDIYVVDTSGSSPTNTWLGDVRIEKLSPDGNGTNTAWGGTTGTYTDWDDTTSHDTDSTYVSSSTPGQKETSSLGALTVTTGTVYAVQTNLTARKDDAGTRTIAPVLRVGGTDYDGTTTGGLTTTYVDYTQLYDRLDPSGAAWTVSTVNAMEAGVKEIA